VIGGRGDDGLGGGAARDTLLGGSGEDSLWGGAGDDSLDGGTEADLIVGGLGRDLMKGGAGNDTLLPRSDGGEPDIAQDPDAPKAYPDEVLLGNDTLSGGGGADLFRFELLLNAPQEVAEAHADADDGWVYWPGVAGENDAPHDHWVESIGDDVILDFSKAQGDRIEIAGHTVHVMVEQVNTDSVAGVDSTRIELYTDQGPNGGAHHGDMLGTILVMGALLTEADVTLDHGPHYGAYTTLSEAPRQGEDMGIEPGGWWNWAFTLG
jgi:Ca2+-binding RTX toxin-like protein